MICEFCEEKIIKKKVKSNTGSTVGSTLFKMLRQRFALNAESVTFMQNP